VRTRESSEPGQRSQEPEQSFVNRDPKAITGDDGDHSESLLNPQFEEIPSDCGRTDSEKQIKSLKSATHLGDVPEERRARTTGSFAQPRIGKFFMRSACNPLKSGDSKNKLW
jgi:hypothetical protein